ncbi:MAG: flavodoxin [Thermoguttaceae bacterium]|nr:flavodoxin [Thermoguttaceae bacterium]
MSRKALVACFSCSGITKKVATKLAGVAKADFFEIAPEVPYTPADLNWQNQNSRSSVEMRDAKSRPALVGKVENMSDYDIVFLGFPIWWYVAPTIINTFLESYDFAGKTIVLFATSGGSGFGKTVEKLRASVPGTTVMIEGKLFNGPCQEHDLSAWLESLHL